MRVIAITGGIGSGKTTVAALYRGLGVAAVDADAVSRALTAENGEALTPIREVFGDGVFHADGTLNRAALAKRVFGNEAELKQLNAVMHPRIARRIRDELEALRTAGEPAALLEAPLLFEAGMDGLADAVICVTAPEEVRVRRVCDRDGIPREEALRRIRSQNPMEKTESLSDYVLSTDVPFSAVQARALALWRRVLADGPRRVPRRA